MRKRQAVVCSVNVGLPETFTAEDGRPLSSGVRKSPQSGPIRITEEGLDGDGSRYARHGGQDMRVHVFCLENYSYFEERAGRKIPIPAFGENFSLEGCPERLAHVGDRVRVGSAVLQISQPTERCENIGRYLGLPEMLGWMEESLKTGYYLRVIETGVVQAGDTWELLKRPEPGWSIDRLNRAMFRGVDEAQILEIEEIPTLSSPWKKRLRFHHERRSKSA